MKLSRDEINKNLAELTDSTNFAGRVKDATAENALWHQQHPTGGVTPQRSIGDMTKIRHREITIGRTLTEAERNALCA